MVAIKDAARTFLASKRIAITGVSRDAGGHGGNTVYKRLRDRGYEVFAVNPNADTVEGDRAYHHLADIPGGVDAVVIATRPDQAEATLCECNDLGIKQVWMHRGPGPGSVCDAATVFGRDHGMTVIDGGCPLMFDPAADIGHKVMRVVLTATGKVPRQV
jgi:predicted CoA-binding protein